MKEFLKKYAGPLYKVLFHFRYNTRVGRVVFTTVIRALFLVRERINGPYFAFDVCGTMGLGAMLSHTILLLDRCDRKDLTPVIRFSNPLYGSQDAKKRDWFSQFFEVSQHPASKHAKWIFYSKIQSHSDYFADPQGKGLSIERAHELFTRYLTIKDLVYDEANMVFSASKQGKRLGVHFRGTDKVFEAPRVGWNIVSDLVANEIRRDSSITSIFATSDETAFIDFIERFRSASPSSLMMPKRLRRTAWRSTLAPAIPTFKHSRPSPSWSSFHVAILLFVHHRIYPPGQKSSIPR